jgi:CheY-like chemotaxis protein
MSPKKILIVEDVYSIRVAIQELLSKTYKVFDAANYLGAVEILEKEKIDLVLTDINMPGKSGLDLIELIREKFPNTEYSLITAYNINDYIRFAKENSVWNIIPKYSFLDLKFISTMVDKILTKDIFGIEKYFESDLKINRDELDTKFTAPKNKELMYKLVKSDKERSSLCNKISNFFSSKGSLKNINQVLEELTANAMIRAPINEKGKHKFQVELQSKDMIINNEEIELSENDFFQIGYGIYDGTFIFSTIDKFGTLKKEEILNRLDRHITIEENEFLPKGITDKHGRGLYICREISDTIIFNIEKNVKTEVIVFTSSNENKPYKTLSIYEK